MSDRRILVLAESGKQYEEEALEQMVAGFPGKAPLKDEQGQIVGWIDQVTMEKGRVLGRLSGIDPAFLARLDAGDIELGIQKPLQGSTPVIQAVRPDMPQFQPKRGKKHGAA